MKKTLILALLVMLSVFKQAYAYDFSAVAPSGQTLYYNIVEGNAQVVSRYTSSPRYRNIGSLTIPSSVRYNGTTYTVTSIGERAFDGSGSLTSVTIPNSVTTIGSYAFYDCIGLTSVTIPNSVTSIGSYAFDSCSGLTSVTIPNSVTTIGDYAFSSCRRLTSVYYTGDVAEWCEIDFGTETSNPLYCAHNLYINNNLVTDLVIPNGVTQIKNYAFHNATCLTSVTIPNSVTSIGYSAFYGCSGLTSITIPNSVDTIGDYAFYGCSGLTSVTIPNSVTSIGKSAFYGCSGLTSVTIPNSVTSIGSYAFYDCSGLTSVYYSGDVAEWCGIEFGGYSSNPLRYAENLYIGNNLVTDLVIPSGVTQIKNYAFYGATCLTSVTIPNSVTSIGSYAFDDCSGLTSVTIGNSVDTIGDYAFYDCSGLTSVYYSGDVAEWCGIEFGGYYSNPLEYAENLYIDNNLVTDLVIPSGVTQIKNYAFYGATCLTSVTIPNSVTSIGYSAFYGCSGLTSITIGNSVDTIGDYAFYNCSGICGTLVIPNSVTSIGYSAFYGIQNISYNGSATGSPWGAPSVGGYIDGYLTFSDSTKTVVTSCCRSAEEIIIPNSVITIGEDAFEECKKLTSVTIPNSVDTIGDYAFYGCSGLTSVTIPNSVTSIGSSAFYGCSGLTSVYYSGDVAEWCGIEFGGYSSNPLRYAENLYIGNNLVTDLVIPSGVTQIKNYAFYGATCLTSVTIPNSATSIGESAFDGCSGLTSVTIGNSVDTIGDYAFYDCSGLTSVTIPNSVTSIGVWAFKYCSGLTSVYYSGDVAEWCGIEFGGYYSNPLYYAENLYIGNNLVTDLVIPSGVTQIKDYAFRNATCLTSVTIPNSVTSIGYYAFDSCSGLTSVTIGNSVDTIGDYAFYNCSGICGTLVIPNSVTSIGYLAFYGIQNISYNGSSTGSPWGALSVGGYTDGYLTFSDSTKTVVTSCCRSAEEIIIPNSVITIGDYAFYVCSGLTSVTIPNSVTTIGKSAFYGCSGLTSVTIPNSVTSIGFSAFDGCSGLTSVTIGNSVTSIGSHAFYGCSGLMEIYAMPTTAPTLSGYYCFDGVDDIPVYIPCGRLASYNSSWNLYFSNFIEYLYEDYSAFAVANDEELGGVEVLSMPHACEYSVQATPNEGCEFLHWSDGSTDNPYTFALTSDTALTAYFARLGTLTVTTNNSAMGNVTGGGTYFCGTNVEIAATANYGYHFTQWNDGNTENPRTITLTCDTSFVAFFAPNQYTVTGVSQDNNKGSVSGTATVDYLDTVTLHATPNYGYHFDHWQVSGNNGTYYDNPLEVVADEDKTVTAYFAVNHYNITLNSDNNTMGSVSGSGSYIYLSERTITATANYGYHFARWNDGNTDNPRTITLTCDTSFTAFFAPNQYTVTGVSQDNNMGSVTGTATVDYLDTVTLHATSNYGYHFLYWKINGINRTYYDSPLEVVADGNKTVTAYFAANQYNITLNTDNNTMGSVSGSGSYNYLSERTITATANYGYHFVRWNDGNTDNPRTITLTCDTSFVAFFAINQYTVTGVPQDNNMGSVTGTATVDYLGTVTLSANANYGYHFDHWLVGGSNEEFYDNPINVVADSDKTVTAYFTINQYSITVNTNNSTWGTVLGSGAYDYLSERTIVATANYGYHFSQWDDGNTDNPRTITLSSDTTLTAYFDVNRYTLILQSNDAAHGSANGGGMYDYLDTVTITATAVEHYHFVSWSDGNIDNPRRYVITGDCRLNNQVQRGCANIA